jgi:hypothetical protein
MPGPRAPRTQLTEFRFHVHPADFGGTEVPVAEITMVIGGRKIGQRLILEGPSAYESVIDYLMKRATAQLKDAVKAAHEEGELT